jgi:hypothetical protein
VEAGIKRFINLITKTGNRHNTRRRMRMKLILSRVRSTAAFVAILIGISLLTGCADTANSQVPEVDAMMQQMIPLTGKMMEVAIESSLATLARIENTDRLATFSKNFYDALVTKGFSNEEAMQIVISVGMPSMPALGE